MDTVPADPFAIEELPRLVPEGAVQADLAADWTRQFLRRSELEDQLAEERQRAAADTKRLLLGMLEVVDRLEVLLAQPATEPSTQRLLGRVGAAHGLLLKKLAGAGVVPVDVMGRSADPEDCDVEDTEERADLPDETVLRELLRAYRWQGRSLRRAKVLVSVLPQGR